MVSNAVGFLAICAARHNTLGRAAQILNEYDAQRDCHRPEFSDRKWLNALVGAHKPAKCLNIEAAVSMRDECPSDPEHAWIALKRTFCKLGELVIIAPRKIVVDFANLFIHDMKIINQPLSGRHDDLSF